MSNGSGVWVINSEKQEQWSKYILGSSLSPQNKITIKETADKSVVYINWDERTLRLLIDGRVASSLFLAAPDERWNPVGLSLLRLISCISIVRPSRKIIGGLYKIIQGQISECADGDLLLIRHDSGGRALSFTYLQESAVSVSSEQR